MDCALWFTFHNLGLKSWLHELMLCKFIFSNWQPQYGDVVRPFPKPLPISTASTHPSKKKEGEEEEEEEDDEEVGLSDHYYHHLYNYNCYFYCFLYNHCF